MPFTAALVGGGLSIAGSLFGAEQAKGAHGAANDARAQALAQFANLSVPDIEKMKLQLQQYGNAGDLTPEMVELITQGDSALTGVTSDPRLRASQLQSLAGIEELANRGMNTADEAAYELARRNAAGEAQAKQNQILQNMQQRGAGGSGAELLASLQNSQSGADRLQQAQLEEAKMRQQARQQALVQQSQMSGNLRGQDYNEQAALANSRDQIARFNAANAQAVASGNTGSRNQAQQFNLTNEQNRRNLNTGLSNQEQQFNKNLNQVDYNNKLGLATAKSGQYQASAKSSDEAAGRTAGMYAGIGQGLGGMVSAFGKGAKPASDDTVKKVSSSLMNFNEETGRYE